MVKTVLITVAIVAATVAGIDLGAARWKRIPGTEKATEPMRWPEDFDEDGAAGVPVAA